MVQTKYGCVAQLGNHYGNLCCNYIYFCMNQTQHCFLFQISSCIVGPSLVGPNCSILVDHIDQYTWKLYLPDPINKSGWYKCQVVTDPAVQNYTWVEVKADPPAACLSCIRGNNCSVFCPKGTELTVVDNGGHKVCHCKGKDCKTSDWNEATVKLHGCGIDQTGMYRCYAVDNWSPAFTHTRIYMIEPYGVDSENVATGGPPTTPTTTTITTPPTTTITTATTTTITTKPPSPKSATTSKSAKANSAATNILKPALLTLTIIFFIIVIIVIVIGRLRSGRSHVLSTSADQ
ncbi:Hypp1728 [Branchiostoma lanceolatum]|uniref:Hypp1728 protein n=1 Tax=Branchiostoma lanceolatum TaxID=7740 RepID=A0A8J9ZMY9_BRALA|nr:Hypp1728 [Branchiostoma lanceolatum]